MNRSAASPIDDPQMKTARSVIGLIGGIGFVANILFSTDADEIEVDIFVWGAAFLAAGVFWYLAGPFLERPTGEQLKRLRLAGNAFTALWVLGAIATYAVWEELLPATYAGIGVGILGSFLVI